MENMDLSQLPGLVLAGISEYLSIYEVVTLREVCAGWKEKVEDHVLKRRFRNKNIVFSRVEEFSNFVDCVKFVPFSKFQFRFEVFGVPELRANLDVFLKSHGKHISSLKLTTVHVCRDEFETAFFDRMPNLRCLKAERIKLYTYGYNLSTLGFIQPNVSMTIQNLGEFAFEDVVDPFFVMLFLSCCKRLHNLELGDIDDKERVVASNWARYQDHVDNIRRYVELQIKEHGEMNIPLRTVSLPVNWEAMETAEITDSDLVKGIIKSKVKIRNVSIIFLQDIAQSDQLDDQEKAKFYESILDLNGLTPMVSLLPLTSLAKLRIQHPTRVIGPYEGEFQKSWRNRWNFSKLDVVVGGLQQETYEEEKANFKRAWKFLFESPRPFLTEVSIRGFYGENLPNNRWDVEFDMLRNHENLKHLTLRVPYLNNNDFETLFGTLAQCTKLESLDVSVYCSLTRRLFCGINGRDPNFLKMTNLRHFSIAIENTVGEAAYPNVLENDLPDFMRDILPQTSITCLRIHQRTASNVFEKTADRIEALLAGPISDSLRYLQWTDIQEVGLDAEYNLLRQHVEGNKRKVVYDFPDCCKWCRRR